jgi:hypothetical protein
MDNMTEDEMIEAGLKPYLTREERTVMALDSINEQLELMNQTLITIYINGVG